MAPKRVIEGPATKIGRTMHGIAVDPVHDEIVVPNPLASAVLVFRGQAVGNEPPIRVIQGPRTGFIRPHSLTLDLVNDEIVVSDSRSGSVSTFPRSANGDVAPLRAIRGPKTNLFWTGGVAVDPIRNLVLVSSYKAGEEDLGGLYIFGRMDDGDVAPRSVITGFGLPFGFTIYDGKIFAGIQRETGAFPYANDKPKSEGLFRARIAQRIAAGKAPPNRVSQDPSIVELPSPWDSKDLGYLGVWKITDKGNVPPMFVLRGPRTGIIQPAGVAVDPKHNSVFIVDSPTNSILSFLLPELFASEPLGLRR